MKPKSIFVVSLTCLLLGLPSFGQRRHPSATQPASEDAQPAPASPPPTLAQLPATPPQVSFQGGQLTISAQNSTLGDILKAVRTETGATIDLPGNASERVVGQFGPAPARDVLTSLLNGSHFNYMLLGSATDPNALDRVILIAKSGAAAESTPQAPTQQANAYNQAVYNRPTAVPMAAPGGNPGGNTVTVEGQDADPQDDATDDSADSNDDTTDDQTDQADDQGAAADDQQPQQDGQQPVKTPEQLLQELQQRQQQLQQQGVQPGVAPGVPPGVPPGLRQFPNPGVPTQPGGADAPPPHN